MMMVTTMMIIQRFLQLLMVVLTTYQCQARSLPGNEDGDGFWRPPNRTMEEWLNCRGMPEEVCDRVNAKYKQLVDLIAHEKGIEPAQPPTGEGLVPDSPSTFLSDHDQGGCMWLTEEQVDMMYEEAQHRNDLANKRKKRTLSDFKKYPNIKWSLPIHYKFDGTQSDSQKKTIRDAFQHWMDNTCIRFTELPTNTPYTGNHIILTSQAAGCYSYVGKTNYIPQPINLYASCLFRFGTPVHEIGHALGLYHEQMRRDRDSYIGINWSNIYDGYVSQFNLVEGTDGLGQPYNYGSVMHYSSKEAVSKNGGDTMIAKQSHYQMNMGQRTGLSFHDAKLMNLAYCPNVCQKPLSQACQRGGYRNPNDCSRCLCPDGFSGTYCENIAPSKNGNCGGVLNIGPNSQQVITSPGYNDRRYYMSRQECTWWIKAPQNYKLQLTFAGDFGIYCEFGACYHWVEVKYKQDLGQEGGRFCCYDRPKVAVESESNEMMVIFKSNYSVDYFPTQRGFQAVVKTIPRKSSDTADSDAAISSSTTTSTTTTTTAARTTPTTTTTTTTPTTTTPTTTTPTTTTTTTTAATTTTTTIGLPSTNATSSTSGPGSGPRSASGDTLWQCSFDAPSSADDDRLCGMTQDTSDDFDWTVYHDPTPSDPTGPDFPYDGYNFIYIEASAPRKPNDEARLFFPKFNFAGDVCVDFYYHMYGFHVNALKLVRITENESTVVVWMRTKQMGNVWLHASVGVELSKNSQLQFIGIRGEEFSGDIGLDKILVKSGACAV